MRRLSAILIFFAGIFTAELAQPVHCSLLHASRRQTNRREA